MRRKETPDSEPNFPNELIILLADLRMACDSEDSDLFMEKLCKLGYCIPGDGMRLNEKLIKRASPIEWIGGIKDGLIEIQKHPNFSELSEEVHQEVATVFKVIDSRLKMIRTFQA